MAQSNDERLLFESPLDGSKTYFSYEHNDLTPSKSKTTIRTEIDVEPMVERNKFLQNSHDASSPGLFTDGRAMYHVASIDIVEMTDLVKRGVMTWGGIVLDEPALTKWANDPEFKYRRKTTSKRI